MTRVRSLRLQILEVPFREPFRSGRRTWSSRRMGLVRLADDAGHEGLGEVAPEETGSVSMTMPPELAAAVEGLDLADGDALEATLRAVQALPAAGRTFRAAVESAAADLEARVAARSLHALLCPRSPWSPPTADVAVNGLVELATPRAAAARAAGLAAAGYSCVKLKAGRQSPEDLAGVVGAVRVAVGPGVRLRVDANGSWGGARDAVAALRALERYDLEYVEQPLPARLGAGALARLRRATGVAIAVDESVTGTDAARVLVEAGAADVLVVKASRVGGVREALRIAGMAAEGGVGVVLSTMFETGIGIAGALHVAVALADGAAGEADRPMEAARTVGEHAAGRKAEAQPAPARAAARVIGPDPAHGLGTAGLLVSDLLAAPLTIRNGRMAVPEGPGLGVTLDEAAVAAFAVS